MTHDFDADYWDAVWAGARGSSMSVAPPNPHLVREVAGLEPGTALEAGCGAGAEALWLASRGWRVTGVDIAAGALEFADRRAAAEGLGDRVAWVEADLAEWEPGRRYDLVTTHYAHPSIPQLEFYERLAGWVAPGGTLFIVGHLHLHRGHGHHGHHGHGGDAGALEGSQPPAEASVTAAQIAALLGGDQWEIATVEESSREMPARGGVPATVHDVVVSATRRS